MLKSKNALLVGSFLLILLGITLTAILERTTQSSEDVRARATAVGSLVMTATVASVDHDTRTVVVDNLQFDNKAGESIQKSLGTWTVTPPATMLLTSLLPGKMVTMTVDPETLLAATRTLTAKEIKVTR